MEPLLDLPNLDLLENSLDKQDLITAKRMWKALWLHYIRNKGSTSAPYWCEQFTGPKPFNIVLMVWAKWINSVVVPERSWAEISLNESALLELFTENELIAYRADNKLKQYLPRAKASELDSMVRINGSVKETGLIRTGFQQAANSQYFYDPVSLSKHKQLVINSTNKSMRNLRELMEIPLDAASYDVVSTDIVEYLCDNPFIMTQGNSYSDSRGRAIKESLRYVANPIGYKAFRSLITIPLD